MNKIAKLLGILIVLVACISIITITFHNNEEQLYESIINNNLDFIRLASGTIQYIYDNYNNDEIDFELLLQYSFQFIDSALSFENNINSSNSLYYKHLLDLRKKVLELSDIHNQRSSNNFLELASEISIELNELYIRAQEIVKSDKNDYKKKWNKFINAY